MPFSDLIKKLLGFPVEPEIEKLKPGVGEKTFGDLEYELAKQKAKEARENPNLILPPSSGSENS